MDERLNLLRDAGVIDKDIHSGMLRVVALFAGRHLPVYSEQGEIVVTHMANALMRSRRGEVIEPLDGELLNEMASSMLWASVLELHGEALQLFAVAIHPNEEGYLQANLYGLYMAAIEHAG